MYVMVKVKKTNINDTRVSYQVLTTMGLMDWITRNIADYVVSCRLLTTSLLNRQMTYLFYKFIVYYNTHLKSLPQRYIGR